MCIVVLLGALLLLGACTTERLAATAQAYQRNQCNRLPDKADYDRCVRDASVPPVSEAR